MLLSDRDLRAEIEARRLVIEPFDPDAMQPSSIDLRVGNQFRVFHNARYPYIDVRQPMEDLTELVEASEDEPFILHPGEFVLGSTLETVTLANDLVARLEGKSSLGRLGLLIHSSLPGDEMVLVLHEGELRRLPIGEIVAERVEAAVVSFDPETFACGYHDITGWYEGPPDRIFEVVLASGRRVRLTGGHDLFTLDRDGELTHVRVHQAGPGTLVAVPGRTPAPPVAVGTGPRGGPSSRSPRAGGGASAGQVSVPHREHEMLTSVPLPDRLLVRLGEEARLPENEAAAGAGFGATDLDNIERHPGATVQLRALRRLERRYRGAPGAPKLSRLVDGDLAWDEVVEVIDTGRVEAVFDLEVRPGGRPVENFVAGSGVFVSNTAGFVDAGWSGQLTLELSNVANLPITIYPGMRIGQLCVFRLSSPAERPYGSSEVGSKYHGQTGPTASRYFENFVRPGPERDPEE